MARFDDPAQPIPDPADADDWQEHQFLVDPTRPLELTVDCRGGDVRVRAADRDDVLVRSLTIGGRHGGRDARLHIATDDNRIQIRTDSAHGARWAGAGRTTEAAPAEFVIDDKGIRFSKGWLGEIDLGGLLGGLRGGDGDFDLVIELPRRLLADGRSSVAVHTASGDLTVEDLTGQLSLATASGDARARGTRGTLAVRTASGDALLDGHRGALEIRSGSGDIHVRGAGLARLAATTASGDIEVRGGLIDQGPFRVESVSGDVRIDLAAGDLVQSGGLTLTFATVSGDADVSPPLRRLKKRAWRLGPGEGGGVVVAVKTVSGDLRARLTDDRFAGATPSAAAQDWPAPESDRTTDAATPAEIFRLAQAAEEATPRARAAAGMVPPAPPAPTAPPAAPAAPIPMGAPSEANATDAPETSPRLAILQALERGEIDIDEAMRRLDQAGA